jgi:hypothetical protein
VRHAARRRGCAKRLTSKRRAGHAASRCRAARKTSAHKRRKKASAAATVPPTSSPIARSPFAQRLAIGLSGPLTELSRQALNALIGSFPIPPFLLPIYQAAGIEYGVPWQVLAGINEIETNFGRNLGVSSAGAEGWMQFLPSTWARYGVDADGRGRANPYDPVDAIFSAARYLAAADSIRNLPRAIFAYNHANWYVNSVELRARLLQLLPQGLVDGLSSLMVAKYPIAGHLGAYATLAPKPRRVLGRPALEVPAPPDAPVIAVADGRVLAIGADQLRGRYIVIEDSFGNRYTYEHLGSIAVAYPVVTPTVDSAIRVMSLPKLGTRGPARLFSLPATKAPASSAPAAPASTTPAATVASTGTGNDAPLTSAAHTSARQAAALFTPASAKQRLFANPLRPASYAAGGYLQLQSSVRSYASATSSIAALYKGPADYYSQQLRLKPQQFTLAPLQPGAIVLAGTVLGRVAPQGASSSIVLQVRPAGARGPVNPTPIVAAWRLLGRLITGHRAAPGLSGNGAYGSSNPTVGQLLLANTAALREAVLTDSRVQLDACDRTLLATQKVDRRLLAVIEYLSYAGLAPTVTEPACAGTSATTGSSPMLERLMITALNGEPVAGNTQRGGPVDVATRLLLGLRGVLRPTRVIGPLSYPWEPAALMLPDHSGELEIDLNSPAAPKPQQAAQRLTPRQWTRLISRLSQPGG